MPTAYLVYCANLPNIRHFPEASLALANELRKVNIPSAIIDLRLVDEDRITIQDPLFFGFTIYSNDSIKYAVKYAKKIRKRFPNIPFVWGGPHVHMMPEQTVNHELVDLACYGEGEITIRELGKMLLAGEANYHQIPGVVFKQGGEVYKTEQSVYEDLDDLDFYPYELLKLSLYKTMSNTHFYYQTSRGCVHRCRFCNFNYQYKWRGKSSDKVVSEIVKIINMFNPYEFYFYDGNFFANKRRVYEIVSKLKEKDLEEFKWTAFCRFDDLCSLSEETLKLMKETGCFKLNMGGESGSDRILKYLNKGITSEQIIEGIKRCNEYGIIADVSFMTGTPATDEEDINKTLDIISIIQKNFPENLINALYYFQPYPNTPLMDEIAQNYNLPLPVDLEGWGEKPITTPCREYLPWLSDELYSKIFTLTQIFNFLYYRMRLKEYVKNNLLGKRGRILLKLSSMLLPFAKFRLEKRNFLFPAEWKLYYIFKKLFLSMDL